MNHKEFFMFVQLIIKELLYVCQISYSDKGFRRFCLFLLYHESCGILLPWPRPSAVIAWSPNRWTIRETPQISLTFGLRCEEEKGFVLQQWVLLSAFTLRKMKENLCNFFLFCEHIRALLFSCICGFLAIFRLGRGGGCCDCWSCENVKLDNIWNAKLQSIQSLLKKKKQREFHLPGPTMQDLPKNKAQQDPRSSSLPLGKGQECGQRLKGEWGAKPWEKLLSPLYLLPSIRE